MTTFSVVDPEVLSDVGVKVAVAPGGRPATEKLMVPENPDLGVTETV